MANIKVLIYDQANTEYDVSYIQEIPLSLNFLIADVSSPDKRNTSFSKSINFPGTKEVDRFFSLIWRLNNNLIPFDPRLKCKIKYYVNELLQLDGDLQLIKVVVDPESKEKTYQTQATGVIGNLFLSIGDAYLTDINLSSYNHALTKANVVASWTATAGTGYYYGLINYGQNQVNSEAEYHIKHLRPQIYKRELLSKIFTAAGYTWTSAYLDSAYFKAQVIPFSNEYLNLGTTAITNSQFYARRNATQTGVTDPLSYTSNWIGTRGFNTSEVVLFNEDNVLPYNDGGAQYATGTGIFTPATTNNFKLETLINVELAVTNTLGTATNMVINSAIIEVYITKYNGIGWQAVAVNTVVLTAVTCATLTSPTYQIYCTAPNFSMLATENYRVEILGSINVDLYTAGAIPVVGGTSNWKFNPKINSTYNAKLVNNEIIEGGTVEVNQCLPTEVKQIDWLMTEVKAANLYMIPNPSKTNDYIIEPRDSGFYTGTDNWSEYLDFSKEYEVLPVSELDTKRYEFWNKQDSDEFNAAYFKEYKETYGFGYTDCVSDFIKPIKKTELIYSPTPIVSNNINGLILPKIYKNDNGTIKPMKSVIRSLYNGGVINLSYGSWTLKSSLAGDTVYTTYPFVGDCDNPYNPTLSLGWDTPHKLYYNYINATYTNNSLKNKYYSKMINQLSDKKSRVVKAWFNLDELTIKRFSFRKAIWIDHFNAWFYVEKIENYNVMERQSTLVTLLKLENYSNWVGSNTVGLPDPEPIGTERIINGNYSNGTNNTNNGTASHIVGGSGNFIAAGATDIQLDNCTNIVVLGDVTGFRGIGLSNVVIPNTSSNSTISAPNTLLVITADVYLDVTYHNRTLLIDATLGNITVYWDYVTMQGVEVTLIRVDTSVNLVYMNDVDAVATVIGNAVPYDLGMVQYDAIPFTSYGSVIYIAK